jgi:hypothetical protein
LLSDLGQTFHVQCWIYYCWIQHCAHSG